MPYLLVHLRNYAWMVRQTDTSAALTLCSYICELLLLLLLSILRLRHTYTQVSEGDFNKNDIISSWFAPLTRFQAAISEKHLRVASPSADEMREGVKVDKRKSVSYRHSISELAFLSSIFCVLFFIVFVWCFDRIYNYRRLYLSEATIETNA